MAISRRRGPAPRERGHPALGGYWQIMSRHLCFSPSLPDLSPDPFPEGRRKKEEGRRKKEEGRRIGDGSTHRATNRAGKANSFQTEYLQMTGARNPFFLPLSRTYPLTPFPEGRRKKEEGRSSGNFDVCHFCNRTLARIEWKRIAEESGKPVAFPCESECLSIAGPRKLFFLPLSRWERGPGREVCGVAGRVCL